MNYKDTLLFIGKSLTLAQEVTYHKAVRESIENGQVDWDKVVQVSTEHYIFPVLYVNFEKTSLLKLLPPGLVAFMNDVYMQNGDRNRAILQQTMDISALLRESGIPSIFIKGSGLLVDGLYRDMGERMISDINVLVEKGNVGHVTELLLNNGYRMADPTARTLWYKKENCPRLVHDGKVAAIALSYGVLENEHNRTFAKFASQQRKAKNGCTVLGHTHQMFLAIMANYHEEYGYKCYATPLRNVYDVYLLSKKINSFDVLMDTPQLYEMVNSFLAMAHYITRSSTILFIKSKNNYRFLSKMERLLENPRKYKKLVQFRLFVEFLKQLLRQSNGWVLPKRHKKPDWHHLSDPR